MKSRLRPGRTVVGKIETGVVGRLVYWLPGGFIDSEGTLAKHPREGRLQFDGYALVSHHFSDQFDRRDQVSILAHNDRGIILLLAGT